MRGTRGGVAAALGLAVVLLIGPSAPGGDAVAGDRSVARLSRIAAEAGQARRVDAIEQLRRIDSDEAHKALESLADSSDPQVALLSLSAIGRSHYAGARRKLEGVFADAGRRDTAREVAVTMWCRLRAKEGASWQEIEPVLVAQTKDNAHLAEASARARTAYFSRKEAK